MRQGDGVPELVTRRPAVEEAEVHRGLVRRDALVVGADVGPGAVVLVERDRRGPRRTAGGCRSRRRCCTRPPTSRPARGRRPAARRAAEEPPSMWCRSSTTCRSAISRGRCRRAPGCAGAGMRSLGRILSKQTFSVMGSPRVSGAPLAPASLHGARFPAPPHAKRGGMPLSSLLVECAVRAGLLLVECAVRAGLAPGRVCSSRRDAARTAHSIQLVRAALRALTRPWPKNDVQPSGPP